MELYRLTFAKMIKHDHFLAEIVVDEGVLITMKMVNEYHQWINANLKAPCYLIVNKLNAYRFSPASEKKIGSLFQIACDFRLAHFEGMPINCVGDRYG